MDLPNEIVINFISDFCICHFKDNKHDLETPPHYYVNVPINDDSSLLLCIITSQIENKKKYYSRVNKKALKSLVHVDIKALPFLSKESIIDCNNAELFNKIELSRRLDSKHNIKVIDRNIQDSLKHAVTEAIKNSPLIKKYIKKMLKT